MQSHVFKHKRRVNGKIVASRCWYGRYKLPGDLCAKTVALETTDKDVARGRLRKIVARLEGKRLASVCRNIFGRRRKTSGRSCGGFFGRPSGERSRGNVSGELALSADEVVQGLRLAASQRRDERQFHGVAQQADVLSENSE